MTKEKEKRRKKKQKAKEKIDKYRDIPFRRE